MLIMGLKLGFSEPEALKIIKATRLINPKWPKFKMAAKVCTPKFAQSRVLAVSPQIYAFYCQLWESNVGFQNPAAQI